MAVLLGLWWFVDVASLEHGTAAKVRGGASFKVVSVVGSVGVSSSLEVVATAAKAGWCR